MKKEVKQKATRHICRQASGMNRACLFRWLRAAPFVLIVYPIYLLTRGTTPSLVAKRYSANHRVYIGRSSDFRCGFVCPQSFAALHQRRPPQSRDSAVAKPVVRNFVDAISHGTRLHMPHLHFSEPAQTGARSSTRRIAFRFVWKHRGCMQTGPRALH